MFSFSKKFIIGIVGALLVSVLGVTLFVSAQGGPSNVEEEGRAGACLDQFGVFMSSLLSADSAKDFFDDLFKRNRCQQQDIFELQDKIEAKEQQLRGAYFDACFGENINTLRNEIYELRMEQHFVQHVVPLGEDTSFSSDLTFFRENLNTIKKNLKAEMSKLYVTQKEWVSEEDFDRLFEGWEEQYEDRLNSYIECSSSPWQEVADKWKEFQEGVQALKELGAGANESADRTRSEQTEASADQEKDAKPTGEKDTGSAGISGFLDKLIMIRIQNVEPERGLKKLTKDLEEMGELPNLNDLNALQDFELNRLERETSKAELLAKYELLYGRGSAEVTDDLANRLKDLIFVIRDTSLSPLKGLEQAAKGIHEKQGKTSP